MNTDPTPLLLLIEDDPNQLLLLRALMTRSGFRVLTASTGFDGLTQARRDRPDLIVCDVMMPSPNGMQLKQLLSQDPGTASIPFVFLTARDGLEDKLEGLSSGADDYITKPFNPRELIERVRAVLRRHRIGHQQGLAESRQTIEQLQNFLNMTAHLVEQSDQIVEKLEVAGVDNQLGELFGRDSFEQDLDRFDPAEILPAGVIVLRIGLPSLRDSAEHAMLEVCRHVATGATEDMLLRIGHDALALLLTRSDETRVDMVRQRIEAALETSGAHGSAQPHGLGLGVAVAAPDTPLSVTLHHAEARAAAGM